MFAAAIIVFRESLEASLIISIMMAATRGIPMRGRWIVGGILLGIDGILILLMYKKIGGKNILIYPLSLVFLLGVIYEIIYFIK